MEAEKAQMIRDELERQNGSSVKRGGKDLEIADMGITYDYEGKVMKV